MPSYLSDSKALMGRNGACTRWTISEVAYPLNTSDIHVDGTKVGHIHFHTNVLTSQARAWMLNANSKWEDITCKWCNDWTKDSESEMLSHPPLYPTLQLTISPEYKPNWIQFSTFAGKLKTAPKLNGSSARIANFPAL